MVSITRTQALRQLLVACAVVIALPLAACGSASPKHGDIAPVDGRIASLPKYPESTAAGPLSAEGGVRTRSFLAFNVSPQAVVQWYQGHLEGWTEVGAVQTEGTQTVRSTWKKGNEQLQVSAAPAPTTQHAGSGPGVQYDLLLKRVG